MEQMMSSMGFSMGGDSKMGNLIGGMVDSMMGNIESEGTMMGSGNSMMNGMENSPSMGSQMRASDNLMGKLFK
jgi:hypothetical protein